MGERKRKKKVEQRLTLWAKLQVLISSYNSLDDGRYFDVESRCSFAFDHITQVRALVPYTPYMRARVEERERGKKS